MTRTKFSGSKRIPFHPGSGRPQSINPRYPVEVCIITGSGRPSYMLFINIKPELIIKEFAVRSRFVIGFAAAALSACSPSTNLWHEPTSAAVAGSSTIIVYHSGEPEPILAMAQRRGATIIYDLRRVNAVVVRPRVGADIDKEIQDYERLEGVETVARDGVSQLYHPN